MDRKDYQTFPRSGCDVLETVCWFPSERIIDGCALVNQQQMTRAGNSLAAGKHWQHFGCWFVLCGAEVHSLWKVNCTHAGGSTSALCHTGRIVVLTLVCFAGCHHHYHGDTLPPPRLVRSSLEFYGFPHGVTALEGP